MSADSDALHTVQQLPGLTPGEQQYLLAVARGEGFYGLGWGNPPQPGLIADQTHALGLTGTEGAGSNNWGAVQGVGSNGSFPHLDHSADGSPYKGIFKRYLTPVEGAADVAKVLLKSNVRAAIAKGDLRGAVYAQHDNRYFELAPDKYLAAVKKNYDILTDNLKWPILLTLTPPTIGETIAAHPLVSGFLSPDWEPSSSGELSEVLDAADRYLEDDDGKV